MDLPHRMGEAVVVGPVLMGTRLRAHLVQCNSTVEDLVNLTATGIVLAAPAEESPIEPAPRYTRASA